MERALSQPFAKLLVFFGYCVEQFREIFHLNPSRIEILLRQVGFRGKLYDAQTVRSFMVAAARKEDLAGVTPTTGSYWQAYSLQDFITTFVGDTDTLPVTIENDLWSAQRVGMVTVYQLKRDPIAILRYSRDGEIEEICIAAWNLGLYEDLFKQMVG